MNYPPFVCYKTIDEYREHFYAVYCKEPIECFDGIKVRFRKSDFDHAFYESSRRDGNKNIFSQCRAERIDWIKTALQDTESERYVGWDNTQKQYDRNRRVTIVMGNYVVVIIITGEKKAVFKTAFVDRGIRRPGKPTTVDQIRNSPKWV